MDHYQAALAGADLSRSVQDRAADAEVMDAMESLAIACEVDWSIAREVADLLYAEHLTVPAKLRAIRRIAGVVAEESWEAAR